MSNGYPAFGCNVRLVGYIALDADCRVVAYVTAADQADAAAKLRRIGVRFVAVERV